MWTRKELKQRAKVLFKANYWKAVLAAIILSFIVGGFSSGGSGAGISSAFSSMQAANTVSGQTYSAIEDGETFDLEELIEAGGYSEGIPELPEEIRPYLESETPPTGLVVATIGMVLFLLLILTVIGIATDILLFNPLEVGVRRFYSVNMYEKAQVRELAYAFDHSYKNIIKVMFFRDLYTFLWSLLFIIPGIVKSYEYRMIPYLLAEYPEMSQEDAFAISKYMMNGNKWKTFVLDLSFILWFLGSIFTLGLLGLFYGDPYYAQTSAVLYDALKAEKQPFARNAAIPAGPGPQANPYQPYAPYAPYQQPVQNPVYQPAPHTAYQQPAQNPMYQPAPDTAYQQPVQNSTPQPAPDAADPRPVQDNAGPQPEQDTMDMSAQPTYNNTSNTSEADGADTQE